MSLILDPPNQAQSKGCVPDCGSAPFELGRLYHLAQGLGLVGSRLSFPPTGSGKRDGFGELCIGALAHSHVWSPTVVVSVAPQGQIFGATQTVAKRCLTVVIGPTGTLEIPSRSLWRKMNLAYARLS